MAYCVNLTAALCALACLACGRTPPEFDERAAADTGDETNTGDATTGSGDTGGESTGISDATGETEDGDGDGDDEEEEGPTCREILECVAGCFAEQGIECIGGCGENSDPAETEAATALFSCLTFVCVDQGDCSLQDIQDPACITCIGFGLVLPSPPGCEEEAAACQ